jgi:hypothetical protein
LRVTANLLFEKGEDPKDVARLVQGFVAPTMVYTWYDKYCEVNGLSKNINRKSGKRRMPMPPIDWDAVKIKTLDEMVEEKTKDSLEPEW